MPKAFKIFILVFGHSAVYKRIIVIHASAVFLYNRGFHNECKVAYFANVDIEVKKKYSSVTKFGEESSFFGINTKLP